MSEKNLQNICKKSLEDNKAENILALDIEGISSFADVIMIATANSNRHAKSLANKLVESIKANNKNILNVEGKVESGWILVDCGGVVVNIMKEDIREFYDLEGLWGENTLLNSSNK
ncbi:MAG: ribosome-associated protein, iojap family [SAR86 cluster bacterium SAR86B]|uniref:Ribosomal silencing factor RsfS n=1 Tax=SAR86 cluster bacterium SAR86B TaxID=1123867 RepID=J4KSS7_9GAMM|nr:MAG: ribosome-associated protein, iojap family [SAR86 cluster bacterium SAR86B]